jgi:hypothetical protein
MKKANIPALPDLQEMAIIEGVQFVAGKMPADMMGFTQNEFIEGVTIQPAETFLKYARLQGATRYLRSRGNPLSRPCRPGRMKSNRNRICTERLAHLQRAEVFTAAMKKPCLPLQNLFRP